MKFKGVFFLYFLFCLNISAIGDWVPGTIICHSPAISEIYLGSPGIAILLNGDYVAKCDEFGPKATVGKTLLFTSKDNGRTWIKLPEVNNMNWASLFVHGNALYLIGTNKVYKAVVIRKSVDGGKTWTLPKDKNNGILLDEKRYHCAPVPVVEHKGRLWRGMEDMEGPKGHWGSNFRTFMMSVRSDVDFLKSDNWVCSNPIESDSDWLDKKFGAWLEGNAVVSPEGKIVNILRVDYKPEGGKAAMVRISDDGLHATFNPEGDLIDLPGGCKKFTIRYDSQSKLYWTLSNAILPEYRGGNPERTRNVVALISSTDLRKWKIRNIVLHHTDVKKHGFQYVDWLFEDEDIVAVSRTAYDDGLGGADNQHNANFLTFHRIEDFRKL